MSERTLREHLEDIAEKKRLTAVQRELTAQRDALRTHLAELKRAMQAEQADVDRLEGHSLTAFFCRVTGKIEEKLDEERRQAWAARVKYDTAARELEALERDLAHTGDRLRPLAGCEQRYEQALARRLEALRASGTDTARTVLRLEEELARLGSQKRELREALAAGEAALRTTEAILQDLDSAEGLGAWDLFADGGIWLEMAKHADLDAAQQKVEALQAELRRFKTELADVEIDGRLQLTLEGFLRFADYFFDGLFADWAVLDHIQQAKARTRETQAQIRDVLATLARMDADFEMQAAARREQLAQLALDAD